jgi:putative phosphoribosyl transferase
MGTRFADRTAAGQALAAALRERALTPPIIVLALPRGGVPLGAIVARALHAPLDVLLVRKIGAPGRPELAVAAVVDGTPPEVVVDQATAAHAGADAAWIAAGAAAGQLDNQRRRQQWQRGRAPAPIDGATVVVVDDGIATGTTARAALQALRRRHPARLVLAVPVAPPDTAAGLRSEVDELVCLAEPSPFIAVGRHYDDFGEVSDDEVLRALDAAARG